MSMIAKNKKTGKTGVVIEIKDDRICIKFGSVKMWGLLANFDIETEKTETTEKTMPAAIIKKVNACRVCGDMCIDADICPDCDLVFSIQTGETINKNLHPSWQRQFW